MLFLTEQELCFPQGLHVCETPNWDSPGEVYDGRTQTFWSSPHYEENVITVEDSDEEDEREDEVDGAEISPSR